MKIAVDVRVLKDNTGVTRHVKSILDKLQDIDNENEYFLYSNRFVDYQVKNPLWYNKTKRTRIPGTLWLLFVLPFFLKKSKINVLWATGQICPFIKFRIKVILSVYDLVYKHYPETMKPSVRIISQLLIPLSMRWADCITVLSNFIKNDIAKTYYKYDFSKKIKIIPCGSPEWKITDEMRNLSQENYLLFVGNLEPRKNLVMLLSAIEILYKNGTFIHLHIVGPPGWENSEIWEKLLSSPIKDQVSLTGYLSETDLITEYIKCKAVIFPSIYEGFGLPLLEALYLNKPVITSKGTVMEEIAEDCAIYIDPKNINCIASVIMQLYSNDPQPNLTLKLAKSVVNEFSWKKSAIKLMDIFKNNS